MTRSHSLHLLSSLALLPLLLSACGDPDVCEPRLVDSNGDEIVTGLSTNTSGNGAASGPTATTGTTTGTTTGSVGMAMDSGTGGSSAVSAPGNAALDDLPSLAIEESDLVKLEGDTLFVHNEERGLHLVDVADPMLPSVSATVDSVAGEAGELYVHADHAVVLLGEQNDGCALPEAIDSWTVTERHRISSVDLSAEGGPALAADLCLPGHVIASRLLGDTMYVVSAMDKGDASLTWVVGVDVSDPGAATVVSHSVVQGLAHEVHVTENAIYVVQGVDNLGDPVEAEFATHTQVRYFDISARVDVVAGTVTQRGKIDLPGAPQGRFHLDEYEDTFRVVTFVSRNEGSNLYVIDITNPDTLSIKGQLSNIAPTEDLHATRFVGDMVYIVTYEAVVLMTDPLWVVSLEDPSNPTILGHLEVPGFSSYVFPRGDTLLAVGRGDRGDRVAASLFDIQDPQYPRELTRLEFGNDGSFTEGNLDFRGVTVIENPGDGGLPLLALPTTYQVPLSDGSCSQENSLTFIDVGEDSLALRGSVSLSNRVQRSFDKDDLLLAVGRRFVGTVNYARRDAPQQVGGVWLGDANAPIECVPFEDIYGNSTDAVLDGGANGGDIDWWGWDEGWDEPVVYDGYDPAPWGGSDSGLNMPMPGSGAYYSTEHCD